MFITLKKKHISCI